jgi:hypothetical protein
MSIDEPTSEAPLPSLLDPVTAAGPIRPLDPPLHIPPGTRTRDD